VRVEHGKAGGRVAHVHWPGTKHVGARRSPPCAPCAPIAHRTNARWTIIILMNEMKLWKSFEKT
jgi:hypothetical protein